ncbi:HECT-like ubiquitin-conjugating enzyme-binding-domain-containing protein [Desarmillaria tabescens]|uniref:HECT-like ubiquitin-conjugating enzyme-binding-domain-containing protein n=1 Tax=Armillaria tabescens TaxID=1929756 RepID=A0AA39N6B4_ARMTA|nr:HECT-like ubiquitin-conjugating enzyme-binding-domain-containing protein [Desarmillaria tabescens]KAK0458915.1 HECT-like ubiquitin-conjugating enzyme-binding-domain-containing protein [Desarmillaria tabescens]
MATLTRVRERVQPQRPLVDTEIPMPFPRELLQREEHTVQEGRSSVEEVEERASRVSESSDGHQSGTVELMPSIALVERSCLMTLNNLLSVPTRWNPIVPDRRHSMPSTPHTSVTQGDAESSSLALQTLVSNLRNRDAGDMMVEVAHTDVDLISELKTRVEGISTSLDSSDAQLATTLVSLLSHLNRLGSLHSPPSQSRITPSNSWHSTEPADIFDTLTRQLSDLQIERQRDVIPTGSPPVLAVERALLWSRIDEELESVVTMCKERTMVDHLPPQYDPADYQYDLPPEYEYGPRTSIDDSKQRPYSMHSPTTPTTPMNEKMRLDFEAVTMAIDRLYMVAPQLHNQRVELKSSKVAQMEKARKEGSSVSRGKQKQGDIRELEGIFEMLGKATQRSMKDQSVIIEGGMKSRFEKARLRDQAKREAFVEHLAEHSNAGRLHSQDAVLQPKTKDPNAMLTLPEFIREAVPESMRTQDPTALLTLPEFVKEAPPPHIVPPPLTASTSLPPASFGRFKSKKKNRDRSMSAPSLSWLRSSSSRSASAEARSKEASRSSTPRLEFEVNYIAENHETLQHVLVFLSVTGAVPGVDIEAEVIPSLPDKHLGGGDHLVVKSGPYTSLPLKLPGLVLPGKKEIKVQGGHYEIKLATLNTFTPSLQPTPLLDASQLSASSPTSFICASCSLPLIQSSRITQYRDLPSEHWQELVDAWMCHSDQKLHEHIAKNGRGFWPECGQALVGGSYILFEESAMSKTNLYPADTAKRADDWQPVRCLCGAVVGRCQEHRSNSVSLVYRMLKYAIRPVSPTTEPVKLPLSAFIVEDMQEFVQAHASYRFIVLDEEDERPRILMWLFKPSIQLAYAIRSQYALPKTASIQAAKVLFKLLGPTEETSNLKSILDKYPGFPQAEYLFYPMNICRRLAGLLRESNLSYPESMRTMTGLDVGWLHRA